MSPPRVGMTNDGRPLVYPDNPLTRIYDNANSIVGGALNDVEDDDGGSYPIVSDAFVRSPSMGQFVNNEAPSGPPSLSPNEKIDALRRGVSPTDLGISDEEAEDLLSSPLDPALVEGGPSVGCSLDGLQEAVTAARGKKSTGGRKGQASVPEPPAPIYALPDFRNLEYVNFVSKTAVIGGMSIPLPQAVIDKLQKTVLRSVRDIVSDALSAALSQEKPDAGTGKKAATTDEGTTGTEA